MRAWSFPLAVVWVFAARAAGAQPRCLDVPELREAVPGLEIDIEAVGDGPTTLLTLRLGQRERRLALDAPSCDAWQQAALLVAQVLAMGGGETSDWDHEVERPALLPWPPPTSKTRVAPAPATSQAPRKLAARTTPVDEVSPNRETSPWALLASVGFGGTTGIAPRPSWGPRLSVGAAWEGRGPVVLSLELGIATWLGQNHAGVGIANQVDARTSAYEGDLRACPAWKPSPWLSVGGCLAARVLRLHTRAFETRPVAGSVDDSEVIAGSGSHWMGGLGMEAILSAIPHRAIRVVVAGGPTVALAARATRVAGLSEAPAEVDRVLAGARLALEGRWP